MRRRSATWWILTVTAGTVTIGGCGSDRVATVAVSHSRSATVIDNSGPPGRNGIPKPQLRWATGEQLILTTWGSGSCPLLPTAVSAQNAHRISISVGSDSGACTADLTPTDSVLVAPVGLDVGRAATADIQGDEVTLAPRR